MSDGMDEFSDIVGRQSRQSSNSPQLATESTSSKDNVQETLRSYVKAGSSYYMIGQTVNILPPAVYTVGYDDVKGPFFSERDIKLDELLILPDTNCDRVLVDIKDFWTREKAFRAHGFLWKRGVLLWGPPGGGKTSCIQLLAKEIVSLGGLTIFAECPRYVSKALEAFRRIEPNRPIVVILEDIDAIVKTYGESDLLALLDGETQIDNVVFVATTNYPEMLDRRLVNRPSRFDEVIKIGMPTANARRIYLKHKVPRLSDEIELNKWVAGTDGMSIAHLRELIVSVECLGKNFDIALNRLKVMNKVKSSSSDDSKSGLGFLSDV